MSNPFDFHGKVALVTGAGAQNGIGFRTARTLAQLGAKVFLTGASARVVQRAEELQAEGHDVAAVSADLTDDAQVKDLINKVVSTFGAIDILINNAGMTSLGAPMETTGENASVAEMSLDAWNASFQRNVTTAFNVTRHCLSHLRTSGHGRIVFVASVTGALMAMRNDAAYAMSKAAMVGLTRATALDEATNGITVNAVAPGWIATDSQTENEVKQGRLTPMGRSAETQEVANVIAWLASPGASYITGQVIVVDGGNSIAEERA